MKRIRPVAAVALAATLVLPVPAMAVVDNDVADDGVSASYDTPAPRDDSGGGKSGGGSSGGGKSGGGKSGGGSSGGGSSGGGNSGGGSSGGGSGQPAAPTPEPITLVQTSPAKVALAPLSAELVVALPDDAVAGPLQEAIDSDFFKNGGFDSVELTTVDSPLEALQAGEADFAVVDAIEGLQAFDEDPSLQAIAGYQNYVGKDGAYGGTVLMAAPGLVAAEPSTVSGFTKAYIRGLRKFGKKAKSADTFAPLDGGFGKRKDDRGWGELAAYAFEEMDSFPDLEAFVSEHTLNVAQASAGRDLNPVSDLAGAPLSSSITVASPPRALAGGPVQTALLEKYFESAGLSDVNLEAVEEPLLGLLQGGLDIAVLDAVDAADGYAQGLPLAVVAAHRNYDESGDFGGDVIAVSEDFLNGEPSTVESFLTAYMRAMMDFEKAGDADAFAPYDGGFGVYDPDAGWTEFTTFLSDATGADAEDLDGLIAPDALERARTWWGIPDVPEPDMTTADEADVEENE